MSTRKKSSEPPATATTARLHSELSREAEIFWLRSWMWNSDRERIIRRKVILHELPEIAPSKIREAALRELRSATLWMTELCFVLAAEDSGAMVAKALDAAKRIKLIMTGVEEEKRAKMLVIDAISFAADNIEQRKGETSFNQEFSIPHEVGLFLERKSGTPIAEMRADPKPFVDAVNRWRSGKRTGLWQAINIALVALNLKATKPATLSREYREWQRKGTNGERR